MSSNSDTIIWFMLFFVFLIIIGLYISESTPLDLNQKEKILMENFTSTSNSSDQSEGASQFFNWGLPDDKINYDTPKKDNVKCDDDDTNIVFKHSKSKCSSSSPPPQNCSNANILHNKDINKYVLKSSVPPCPDMSEFVTKNMINANPDLSDYILKSEIKPCEKVDITNYILKSEIPACPNCPTCPVCPICPVCPPENKVKCKEIHEYNITNHPDIHNYISKDKLKDSNFLKSICKKNITSEEEEEHHKDKHKKWDWDWDDSSDHHKKNGWSHSDDNHGKNGWSHSDDNHGKNGWSHSDDNHRKNSGWSHSDDNHRKNGWSHSDDNHGKNGGWNNSSQEEDSSEIKLSEKDSNKFKKYIDDIYSKQLNKDIIGYYAGDNLYAGV